ncbi:MAG: STAS domain-containing protein [Oscillospiraceae bacterium]|nr:STAS domain-containing protein [Oscillospiraceae bacterium]
MTIKIVKQPPAGVVFHLEGRLDAVAAPAAQEQLLKSSAGYETITVDLSLLQYVSSAGLRVLLAMQKQANKAGSTLTLTNVSASIKEVLEMTGFLGFLHVV